MWRDSTWHLTMHPHRHRKINAQTRTQLWFHYFRGQYIHFLKTYSDAKGYVLKPNPHADLNLTLPSVRSCYGDLWLMWLCKPICVPTTWGTHTHTNARTVSHKTLPFPTIAAKVWFSGHAFYRAHPCNHIQSKNMQIRIFGLMQEEDILIQGQHKQTNKKKLFPFLKTCRHFYTSSHLISDILKVHIAKCDVFYAMPSFWCALVRICSCLRDRMCDL